MPRANILKLNKRMCECNHPYYLHNRNGCVEHNCDCKGFKLKSKCEYTKPKKVWY